MSLNKETKPHTHTHKTNNFDLIFYILNFSFHTQINMIFADK